MRYAPLACVLFGCGRLAFDPVTKTSDAPDSSDALGTSARLLHWWKLDEAPGALVITDSAGAANITKGAGTATFTAGQVNNALFLPNDGTENDNQVATPTDLLGRTALTMSYWNKRSSLEGAIGQDIGGTRITRISIAPWDDGRVYFSIGTDVEDSAGYFLLMDSNWHMYTMVFDGTGVGNAGRLHGYLDGVEQVLSFQGTIPNATTSTRTNFMIGDGLSDQTTFGGYYDDIRIYDRALTAAEVAALYTLTGGT